MAGETPRSTMKPGRAQARLAPDSVSLGRSAYSTYTAPRRKASYMGGLWEEAMARLDEKDPSADSGQRRRAHHALPSGRPGWQVRPSRLVKPAWPLKRAWILVPAVAAVIGLSVALVYLTAAGGSHTVASGPRNVGTASPNPDSTEPIPQFHVPAKIKPISMPHTDALPLPTALRAEARAWDTGAGGSAFDAVSDQVGNVTQASGLHEYVEMKAACAKLAASVTTAQAAPSIPDTAMQALYAMALTKLAKGAEQCQAAISQQPDGDEYIVTTENQAVLHASESALASGSKDLYRATGEIVLLSRSR